MTYFNGDSYEGNWKDDKKNGFGIMKKVDGSIHKGNWKDDISQNKKWFS
jgi:hypothetical protein